MQQTMSDPRHFWLFANHFPCSIPVGDSDVFFVPRSRHVEHSIFSHFPCVCQLEKSRLTSGEENLSRVTSDNSEHFKIVRISNILVSSVKPTKKLTIPNRKRNSRISSTAKILFRVRILHRWVCLQAKWKIKLLRVTHECSADARISPVFEIFVRCGALWLQIYWNL